MNANRMRLCIPVIYSTKTDKKCTVAIRTYRGPDPTFKKSTGCLFASGTNIIS